MQPLTQAEGALVPTLSSPNRLDAGWSRGGNEADKPAPGYFDLGHLELELRKKVPMPLPPALPSGRPGTGASQALGLATHHNIASAETEAPRLRSRTATM